MLTDFSVGTDKIVLDDQVFAAFSVGTPAADMLHAGAEFTAAADVNDYLTYNAATGALYYDPDGTGVQAATQFATLAAGLALTYADFVVS